MAKEPLIGEEMERKCTKENGWTESITVREFSMIQREEKIMKASPQNKFLLHFHSLSLSLSLSLSIFLSIIFSPASLLSIIFFFFVLA